MSIVQMAPDLDTMLRAADVQRWHTINLVRRQSVAEHQYNVMAIAIEILRRSTFPEKSTIAASLVPYVLFHDLDEVIYGDMPPAAKKKIGPWYASRLSPLLVKMEWELDKGMIREILSIAKAADLIETAWFALENCNGPHSIKVAVGAEQAASNYLDDLPDSIEEAARSVFNFLIHGESDDTDG